MDRSNQLYPKTSLYLHTRKALALGSTKPKWRLAVILITALTALWFLLPYETKAYLLYRKSTTACDLDEAKALACHADNTEPTIPNTVHFVYILSNSTSDFPFQFSHFLSMYAASYRWQPDRIYLHTNVAADSETIQRARDGGSGKWSKLIFDLPSLTINTVTVPTHAGNGKKIASLVHQSDFVRVKAVHDFGGTYIDMDVHPLQDIKPLRHLGFRAAGGRQVGGDVNSGTFMSAKGSKMIKSWLDRMNEVYDGGWTTHSNSALTHVAESLEEEPCEMLILGRDAFAPGGWGWPYNHRLWNIHEADIIPVTDSTRDMAPESDSHAHDSISQQPSTSPGWAEDYSCSFLLHAFSPKKPRHGIKHNGITPRSVLERGSNFARAVYPIANVLFEDGVISVADSDRGF